MLHLAVGALLFLCTNAETPANSSNAPTETSDSYYPKLDWSDTFDWKLLKSFSASQHGNVLISPLSLKLVLALLYEGSSGNTEREFRNVMQFPVQKQLTREKYNHIFTGLQANRRHDYELELGTRIFLDSEIEPRQNYAAKALANYQTSIESTNFTNAHDASQRVNSWIDKVTHGRVTDLVKPGDLEDTVMLIANAIYFRGTWLRPFAKDKTKSGGFYVTPRNVVQVPFMSTSDKFFFTESADLDAKILRMPYKGYRYAFIMVLPNSKGGLPALIKKINLEVLKRQLFALDEQVVEVSIPKFRFNFMGHMSNVLKEYGLHQMFQNTASFPGIARGTNKLLRMLVVSEILQQSGIDLDEEGTVVFSATEVTIGNKFREPDNFFNATHPFLFFIEEETQGTILFVGKVENPLDENPVPVPNRNADDKPANAPQAPQEAAFPYQTTSSPSGPNLQPVDPEKEAILRRFNYFDLELLKEFSETSGNVFISPASIKTTLALILEGARGKCAEEIGNALRIDNIDQREIRDILRRLLFDLEDKGANTVLEAANAVFVNEKFNIMPEYQNKLHNYYKALVKSVDFSNGREAAAEINSWASTATNRMINHIVGSESLFADTTIVLANALSFKGKWKTAFDPKSTNEKCFHSPNRGCIRTPLMQLGETLNYNLNIDLNAHAIELPYQDDKYSMLVLVPSNGNNIKILARDMQHAYFNSILNQLKPTELVLEFPKFEIDYSADLVDYLKPLKIQEIFGSKANLTGIVAQENIKISNIVHKTRVEVNEQGTKAAAVTTAVVIPLIGTMAQRVVVDSPFIFFIYHKESHNIIFEGILVEPQESQTVKPLNTVPHTSQGRSSNSHYTY